MQIVSATPLGNDVVPIDSGRTVTVMLKLAEAVRGGFPESASRTAKFEVPAVHGAPSIVPSVPRVNPVGKEPEATLQEKGGTPPDSCSIAVYALPTTPAGREVVLIEGGGTTVSEAASDFVLSATDVATTLTERPAVTGLGAV